MVARLCFLLKKIISFPTATHRRTSKNLLYFLIRLSSLFCPLIHAFEHVSVDQKKTCEIQKIYRFSPVLLWEMKLFFSKENINEQSSLFIHKLYEYYWAIHHFITCFVNPTTSSRQCNYKNYNVFIIKSRSRNTFLKLLKALKCMETEI